MATTHPQPLLIALAIADVKSREPLLEQLQSLGKRGSLVECLRFADVQVESFTGDKLHADLQAAEKKLADFFAATPGGAAILISDSLADDGVPAEAALHLLDQFAGKLFGTIAVTPDGQRVAEIDRSLKAGGALDHLRSALELVAGRLRYVTSPTRGKQAADFVVRRIRDEYELKKYFQLRHDVYMIMGYLDFRKERIPSRMEIDGCDGTALHFGAFCKVRGRETLAGSFRVLIADAGETMFSAWTQNLLDSDHALRALVLDEVLPLRLPVFHSQQLDDHLQESIQQKLSCAELSRVIVADDFRGLGLSKRLVEESRQEARRHGVQRLYLECLKIHAPIYRGCGFEAIPGKSGRVLGVNRTMIAMQQQLAGVGANPVMSVR